MSLVIQDDVKLSDLKHEVVIEVEKVSKYYNRFLEANTFKEFADIVENFSRETKLIEKCDNLKTYIKKYVMDSAFRLVPVLDEKVNLIVGVTDDLTAKVKAGELVNLMAQQVGGKGGGRPDMAMAGGTQPENIGKALSVCSDWLKANL